MIRKLFGRLKLLKKNYNEFQLEVLKDSLGPPEPKLGLSVLASNSKNPILSKLLQEYMIPCGDKKFVSILGTPSCVI